MPGRWVFCWRTKHRVSRRLRASGDAGALTLARSTISGVCVLCPGTALVIVLSSPIFCGTRRSSAACLLGSAGSRCARGDRPGTRGSAARARASRRPRTAILLNARAAQARQAVLLEGALPGPVLLLGQLVALQPLFEGDAAGAQRTYSAGTRPLRLLMPLSARSIRLR